MGAIRRLKKSPKHGTTTTEASSTSTRTESTVSGPARTSASKNICGHYGRKKEYRSLSCNRRLVEGEGIDILQVAGVWIIHCREYDRIEGSESE